MARTYGIARKWSLHKSLITNRLKQLRSYIEVSKRSVLKVNQQIRRHQCINLRMHEIPVEATTKNSRIVKKGFDCLAS